MMMGPQQIRMTQIFWRKFTVQLTCTLALLGLIACGGGGGSPTDPSDFEVPASGGNIGGDGNIFEPNRLLDIQITLADQDYEVLLSEGRTLASTARECVPEFEYTEFEARVTIDGDTIEKVGVRKKGFLGSLSPTRPSIKLDFDEFIDGQTYQNRKRMTLNNNRQDTSNARQCITYDYFRKAGLAAPQCNFARVTINGVFQGIYTNVEPIKKPFLERVFGDKDGNLYEAQISDFGEFLSDKFEKKTNESENDRTDLSAVADILTLPDDSFSEQIGTVIDTDEFIRFWAMETLLGHWDSATGNANNFYIYQSPVDNRFHFIPWGADASFTGFHFLKPGSGPLYRNFSLASRFYQIPLYREQYLSTLTEYLETIWNEADFEAELNRIATLTGTEQQALETIQTFVFGQGSVGDTNYIRSQRSRLESAIAGLEPAETEYLLPDIQPNCAQPFSSNITANASSFSNVDSGTFNFTLASGRQVEANITFASTAVDSIALTQENITSPPVVSVLLIGVDASDNFTPYVLQVFIEEPQFVDGSHQLHGFATNLILFAVDDTQPLGVKTLALGDTGTITLTNLNYDSGQAIENTELTIGIDATVEFGLDSQPQ